MEIVVTDLYDADFIRLLLDGGSNLIAIHSYTYKFYPKFLPLTLRLRLTKPFDVDVYSRIYSLGRR